MIISRRERYPGGHPGQQPNGLSSPTLISEADFPGRNDFESTIGPDFVDTLIRIYAEQSGQDVNRVNMNDLSFGDTRLRIEYLPPLVTPWYIEILPFVIPLVLVMVFWYVMMRQQTGGNSRVMSFGKSKASMVDPAKNPITFADVAGADEKRKSSRRSSIF